MAESAATPLFPFMGEVTIRQQHAIDQQYAGEKSGVAADSATAVHDTTYQSGSTSKSSGI